MALANEARCSGLGETSPVGSERRPAVYDAIKLVIESVAAAALLLLTSPLILLVMALVRAGSKGPVLFTQKRVGHLGRQFILYKIRTMYEDCERATGAVWSLPGDRRVTPIGRILRASHIDELPQLVNILRGEMGLIGPRPERPEIVAQLERALPEYRRRLAVRPGLTGLAQVLQPPDAGLQTVRRKLNYDLYYLTHRGPWMDLRVLTATILHLAQVPGARISRLYGFPWHAAPPGETHSSLGERLPASPGVQASFIN